MNNSQDWPRVKMTWESGNYKIASHLSIKSEEIFGAAKIVVYKQHIYKFAGLFLVWWNCYFFYKVDILMQSLEKSYY